MEKSEVEGEGKKDGIVGEEDGVEEEEEEGMGKKGKGDGRGEGVEKEEKKEKKLMGNYIPVAILLDFRLSLV